MRRRHPDPPRGARSARRPVTEGFAGAAAAIRAIRRFAVITTLLLATLTVLPGPVGAAGAATSQMSCDIFGAAGNSCVAAYSTVRALYAAYDGPLYQVTRATDGASSDIGLLTPGGYADAAAQDSFCQGTVCTITKLYDQSSEHNDLSIAGVGDAGSADVGARADALPVTVAGHKAYGILVNPGTGYRRSVGTGVAANGQPETIYEVASGTYATGQCCFDFGNVETREADTGAAHMDAIIISTHCGAAPCSGVGPWIQADLENGVYMGNGNSNPGNVSQSSPFITAVLRNDGQTSFALDGGDARAPSLTSLYSGSLPPGYSPMHQEGGIALGTGGDNSNAAPGAFFEGVMTSGYASNATIATVQSNIAGVNYTGTSGGGPGVGITGPAGKCLDVYGDDNGADGANVDIWDCQHDAVDQHWTVPGGLNTGPLSTLNRCLDIRGNSTAPGTTVELWDCNRLGGQQWVQQSDGTLLNPQSGLCLTDPGDNTTNGTVLDIETCAGAADQQFRVAYPNRPIAAPGGKCIDVYGANNGGNGTNVDVWDCLREANDQQWRHNPDQTLTTLGRCLNIRSNSTAPGTTVELRDCNGLGGQKWVQQANGTLLNPQSGLCLTDPGDNTTNGTVLDIETCAGAADQQFFANLGNPINAPAGKCVDVAGDDQFGTWSQHVQLWDCLPAAADQHWVHNSDNSLETLDRCLDIDGNSTAAGAKVELFNCNGVGGQKWVQQADGTLMNPQSGLCLTDPAGNSANGTQLDIETCAGAADQQFSYIGAVGLSPGTEVSFRATTPCCTGDYIRHQNGRAIISPIGVTNPPLDKQDATWIVEPGLANSACLSFESKNYPNGYLRQSGGAVYQQQNDNSAQFATDATFCEVPGNNGQGISLQWTGNTALYLRHYQGELYVASNGGSDAWDATTSWTDDTSWVPTPAWAP